ncbi:MAG: SIS domain-containing protein [Phycisphaerales bacterium]
MSSRNDQRLWIRFPNAGLKTLLASVAELERVSRADGGLVENDATLASREMNGETGWPAQISKKKPADAMSEILSAQASDPFIPPNKRLEFVLGLYRFDTQRNLIDWAIAQSGLGDPLTRFTPRLRGAVPALVDGSGRALRQAARRPGAAGHARLREGDAFAAALSARAGGRDASWRSADDRRRGHRGFVDAPRGAFARRDRIPARRLAGECSRRSSRRCSASRSGGLVATCGNGGKPPRRRCTPPRNSSDAIEAIEAPCRAICLNADPTLTCIANDFGFDQVFARPCEALLASGDALVVFSTSGRSLNLVAEARAAKARAPLPRSAFSAATVASAGLCDVALVVAAEDSGHIRGGRIRSRCTPSARALE